MAHSRHKKPASSVGWHRLALFAVLVVAATGVGAPDAEPGTAVAQSETSTQVSDVPTRDARQLRVSRAAPRQKLESKSANLGSAKAPKTEPTDLDRLYVTTELNVRTEPDEATPVLTVLSPGTKVKATGRTEGDWAEILRDDEYRWVHGAYLSETKPEAKTKTETDPDSGDGDGSGNGDSSSDSDGSDSGDSSGGVSGSACASGSGVEDGLTSNAVAVHRAVCAQFPEVSSYGGVRAGSGEHGSGHALDIMVSSGSLGDSIADWVRANASELGVSEVIWAQQIWTVQRSSEGWRSMPDRGSATANHYDHVHVTVY